MSKVALKFDSETHESLGNMEPKERLKIARMKAGYATASAAANAMSVPISTYSSHENGNRNFDAGDAAKYAQAYGVSSDWLLWGDSGGEEHEQLEQIQPQLPSLPTDSSIDADALRDALTLADLLEEKKAGGAGSREAYYDAVVKIYKELVRKKSDAK